MDKPLEEGQTICFVCRQNQKPYTSVYSKAIVSRLGGLKANNNRKIFVNYIYRVCIRHGEYKYFGHSPTRNKPFSASFWQSQLKNYLVPDEAALHKQFEEDQGYSFEDIPRVQQLDYLVKSDELPDIDGLPKISRNDSLDQIILKISNTFHQIYGPYSMALALRQRAQTETMRIRLEQAVKYFAKQSREAV